MRPGTVHAIILNWRSAGMTLQSAEATLASMDGIDGWITLIDNDSGDGSFETMRDAAEARGWTAGGRLRVLQSGRNGGFGAGNNAAMRVQLPGLPDHVLILNSDSFPRPAMIGRMRDYMDNHPAVGLLGCCVVGTDGAHHDTHFRFPSVASEFEEAARTGPISRLLAGSIVAMKRPDTAGPVDWVAGAALMIRRTVLDGIGGFDESFFLYFEETDLCLRAARAGWPTHYLPDATVVHVGSASTGMTGWTLPPDYWFASREHYYRVNHGRSYALAATGAHILGLFVRRLRGWMGRPDPGFPTGKAAALLRHALKPGKPRQIPRFSLYPPVGDTP